jgi:N-acetylmuramoyl-L-alanine amidase CwlA
MTIAFVKANVAPGNFHKGRRWDGPVDQITIHVTEGSRESVIEWFDDPKAEVSAHYMVAKDGSIVQFVDEEDEAFHNGRVDHPTAPLVLQRPGKNPNGWSIGIEHEGDGTRDLTDLQRKASIELIRGICQRHSIPIDRTHIVGHHEVYSLKRCPGEIDVDLLVDQCALDSHPGSPDIPIPRIVWSNFLRDYLVVTRRISDDEWYYVQMKFLVREGVRAGAPLSQFPLAQPK